MTTQRLICLVSSLLASALLFAGCSTRPDSKFDPRSGIVSKDFRLDVGALIPDSIRQDSKYDNYYTCDHVVFLGQQDSLRYVLSVTFGRALADNRFKRAERDFTGFLYNGSVWITLPYTRMRHDSLRLDINYPYVFGGLNWTQPYTNGEVSYDRHDLKFDLKFSGLAPVQSLRNGVIDRRSHAIGQGTLLLPNDTITGTVYYELLQIEGYNPFADPSKLGYNDQRWFALTSMSGYRVLAAGDSTTAGNGVLKNFVSISSAGSLRYADGSEHVRVGLLETDSSSRLPEPMGIESVELSVDAIILRTRKTVRQGGLCLTLVGARLDIDGKVNNVWGIVEERRQTEP